MPGTTNPQHGVQAFWSQFQQLVSRVTSLETWMRSGSGYTGLAYGSGYSDFDTGGLAGHELGTWLRDSSGMIHLQGIVKKSSAWAVNDVIATLPAGARPDSQITAACFAQDATAGPFMALVRIDPTGGIVFRGAITPAIGTPAALSNMSFGNFAPFKQGN